MLKTAHDAEEFMRTRARVSPSWPGGDLRGRIRCSRLISRRSRQNPLQTGRAIRLNLAKTCSMGLRSGEYFGKKTRRAPTLRIVRRTAFPLWEPRLSRITTSPGLSVGTRNCST